ncbi:molybdenum cofactor biosynthesis protein B [Microbacterium esteraromaticum]|uniref:MogA/MoaB family molybdenum cofactor biosynthesis protein n=1 Tax=Microbacterium esteraromaticum TaxID=57043 RepID=UPI001C9852A9|nr:MogA/MoaB family molybdenum cofactor biosynthesis protein [Microbacterium esteraromaticum]MBY6061422.1 MogA/MoaB family molybdenum cofactor biosynthesis protein [Microbacterium esteraromaticum]
MSTAAVLTVSDRSAAGMRDDAAGPVAVAALREAGFDCADASVVSDGADAVEQALRGFLATGIRLIVTTGGTGVAPRDETPEGTARVIERMLPGVAEQLRSAGAAVKPAAMLSRGVAGVTGRALIVNLPGSPRAVAEGMPLVLSIARHVLDQLDGEDHR